MQVCGRVQLSTGGNPRLCPTSENLKILLDSGALHSSYVSKTWFNKYQDRINPEQIKPVNGTVILGDSESTCQVNHIVMLPLQIQDFYKKWHSCLSSFAVIDTSYDFIVGLPDLCTKLTDMFVKQMQRAQQFVESLQPQQPKRAVPRPITHELHLASNVVNTKAVHAPKVAGSRRVTNNLRFRTKQSRKPLSVNNILDDGIHVRIAPSSASDDGLTDNEEDSDDETLLYPWSNQEMIAPEEQATEDETPVLFKDALNFMEQSVECADLEYSSALKDNPDKFNELNDNIKFKEIMNTLGRQVYVPTNWNGIKMPELELNFHESMPESHTVKARTIPHQMTQPVDKELTRLEQYHLLPSKSPYASALVVAAKATAPFVRMCGDYRWVNQYVLIQHEWIPNVLDSLQKLSGFKYYIDVDLCNAFHQIKLGPRTSDVLSILTPRGLLRPQFLPEGVSPASAILQRYMKEIFKDFSDNTLVIFDNVVIGANTIDELLDHYTRFLNKCIEYNVMLKLSKSSFALRSVNFFGYVVDAAGWRFDIERLKGLDDYSFPDPNTCSHSVCTTMIQQFLGAANFFRPAYVHAPVPASIDSARRPLWVDLTSQLYDMTNKNFNWGDTPMKDYKAAFDALKAALLACAQLYFPDYSLPWILRTDASQRGVGAILYQQRTVSNPEGVGEVVSEPIAVVAHKFSGSATNWATIKQELYGIYHSVSKLSHLLHGKKFVVETDHANLVHLDQSTVAILTRWRLYLQQFNFMIRHIPGKTNLVADALSRQWTDPVNMSSVQATELNAYHASEVSEFEQYEPPTNERPSPLPLVANKAFSETERHPKVSKLEEARKHTERIPDYDALVTQVHGGNNLHFGVETTWKKLSRLFPGHTIPRHYLDFYIATCGHCQKASANIRNNVTQPITRHIVPATIRSAVGIDMITMKEADESGNRYAHVIVNMFSKYTFIYPTKTANATDAARALLRYCATVGPIREVRSDPGVNYTSDVVKEFNKMVGIAHKVSLVDRHESNGVEPYNREIKRHVATLLNEKRLKNNWSLPEVIDLVQLELNTFPRKSTGNYDAMTLQYGTLDNDLSYVMDFDKAPAYTKFVSDLSENQAIIRNAANELRKEHTDELDAAVQNYTLHQEGDLVLARASSQLNKRGKYLGPYIVSAQRNNDVEIIHLSTEKRRTVHSSQVKAFHGDLIQAKALAMEDEDEYELEEILHYEGNPLIRPTLEFTCKFVNDDEPRKLGWKQIKDTQALDVLISKDKSLLPLKAPTLKEADQLRKDTNKQLPDRRLYDPVRNLVYLDVRCRAVFGFEWYEAKKFPPDELWIAEVIVQPKGHPRGGLTVKFKDRLLTRWRNKTFSLTNFELQMYLYTPEELDAVDHHIVAPTHVVHSLQSDKSENDLKICTLNANGLTAAIKKGLFHELPPDLDHLCIQEVKSSVYKQDKLEELILANSYFKHVRFNCSGTPGYAGVAICSVHEPLSAFHELWASPTDYLLMDHWMDGRLLTLVFPNHVLVTAYAPFPKLDRTHVHHSAGFRKLLGPHVDFVARKFQLPTVLAADLNAVRHDMDLTLANKDGICASPMERDSMERCLANLTDSYRHLHPHTPGYTAKGFGAHTNHRFRLDYVAVTQDCTPIDAFVDDQSLVSDHFPLYVLLRLPQTSVILSSKVST